VDVGSADPVTSRRVVSRTWPDPVWLALVVIVPRVVRAPVVMAAAVVIVPDVAVDPHVVRPPVMSADDVDSVI
jgi:hypothetical protein